MPLANAFVRTTDGADREPRFPLDVYFCMDCSLVQLLDVVDPEVLFRNYIYVTGTSETMAAHNRAYAQTVVEEFHLKSEDLVLEIASNDGSLLRCFGSHGVRILGVEPAANIADMASRTGVPTVNAFFNSDTAKAILAQHGPARVVIGNNVLAHVDQTFDFLRGCHALLRDDGILVVEVPYLGELLERLAFDTIYHEHLCYFSVSALAHLYRRAGLSIFRIDSIPVHGGSIRVFAQPFRHNGNNHQSSVSRYLEQEVQAGLTCFERMEQFGREVETRRTEIVEFLRRLGRQGATVAGYGAPAKGTVLLNYCGIDSTILPFTVDRNELKVGLFTPGTHIPVLPVSTLEERQPEYLLLLAWNFAEEIMRQQESHRNRGGKFIIPLPKPRIV